MKAMLCAISRRAPAACAAATRFAVPSMRSLRIATQRLAAALGIEHLRQIGQLMDDDVGTCLHGGVA